MRIVRTILSFIALAICYMQNVSAQIVYQCDFEDAAERQQWVLNTGNQGLYCENKWYIGKAGNHAPNAEYGLFVSSDSINAVYDANNTMFVVAYRRLTIPAGEYDFYFDWKCSGKRTGEEGFYFCWVPDSISTNSNKATADMPAWAKDEQYRLAPCFYGSTSWSIGHIEWTLPEEQTCKLVLIWYNTRGNAANPSACIDNIEIVPKGSCPLPSDFKSGINNDASATIEWSKNGSTTFDIRSYDYQTDEWQMFDSVRDGRITLYNLSEGYHDVYVRSHCMDGNGVGQFVKYGFFMYHKGERCIDYLDLTTNTCRVGDKDNPLGSPRVEDYGYADYDNSLHTIHYVPNERDPYTDGTLLTKPDDAIASVRLGRYAPTFGAACEYKYKVPTGDKAILKVKYAVVLPAPHEPQDNPTFKLEILADGYALEHGCGLADFVAGANSGWKSCQYGSETITWKDWTEVAVNLRDYVGKTITIRLMVTGCKMQAHGAYAYFTLDCESGELSGLNCGEDNPTTSFTAPSGFNYAWYLPEEPGNILSRNQTYTIDPMDTMTYNVDVFSKTNGNCYYTLEACGIPRYPVANTDFQKDIVNCQNQVVFHNSSFVYYKNQVTEHEFTRQEGVDHVYWDFGDGTNSTLNDEYVTHVYPDTGGTYIATLYAYLNAADTVCRGTHQILINLDDVKAPDSVVHLSVGMPYEGKTYWNPFEFDTIYISDIGCEGKVHVHVHERFFEQFDSLCQGGVYEVGGQQFTDPDTYTVSLLNQWGLDSIVTLHLYVVDSLSIQIPDTFVVCADAPFADIPIWVVQGNMDSVYISFTDSAALRYFQPRYAFDASAPVQLEIPDSIRPDYYPAVLQAGSPRCPAPERNIVIQVNYAADSVMMQRFGFIAMLDTAYNGGYAFSSYQWYRNGELLPEDKSYILVDPDDDMYAEYVVVPVRTDGVVIPTCPLIYTGAMAIEDVLVAPAVKVYPRIVYAGGTVCIESDSPWRLVDVLGREVMPSSHAGTMTAPSIPGMYMVLFPDARQTVRIIVK